MADDKVVPIFSAAPLQVSGSARCLGCGHEWEAETRAGAIDLPCPECKTNRGVLIGLCCPEGPTLTCECGNDLFFVHAEDGVAFCAQCGRAH